MTVDQFEQAGIGFGGAIIGAVVGGLFVLAVARGQWKHDRHDASRRSAGRLLVTLISLEGVFTTYLAGLRPPDSAGAFNAFSAATAAELPFITDDQVRIRVLAHLDLCHQLLMVGGTWDVVAGVAHGSRKPTEAEADVLEGVRRHSDAVTEALQAHIQQKPLPTYSPLQKNPSGAIELDALISWPGKP